MAFTFLDNLGQSHFPLNYKTLHVRACAVATELSKQAEVGDRVALLIPSSLEYIVSFFGCLYAGMVAVPLYPPRRKDKHSRVGAVLRSCEAKLAIVGGENSADMRTFLCEEELFVHSHVLSADLVTQVAAQTNYSRFPVHHDLAFLQYTSGSTGIPKGVMISHDNIISNVRALETGTDGTATDVFVNWLPLFHDLGLVNTMLFPVFLGAHSVIMPPDHFVKKPFAWLKAIETYQGTICGGPQFRV